MGAAAIEVQRAQPLDHDEGKEEERDNRIVDSEDAPPKKDRGAGECGDGCRPGVHHPRDFQEHERETDRPGDGRNSIARRKIHCRLGHHPRAAEKKQRGEQTGMLQMTNGSMTRMKCAADHPER